MAVGCGSIIARIACFSPTFRDSESPTGQCRWKVTPASSYRAMSLLLKVPTNWVEYTAIFFIIVSRCRSSQLFLLPHPHPSFLCNLVDSKTIAHFNMASQAVAKSSGTKSSGRPRHITDEPLTLSNWYQQISWINVTFVAGIPLFGFIMAYHTPLVWKTAVWTLIYYFFTGLGITAGKISWYTWIHED